MLEELHVRDLALIEDVWLEFGRGLTVLTGETGAGKTALLGALKLLLGERADSGAVRPAAGEALVEGRFSSADRELLVKRRVTADGRSRCTVDGDMSTVGSLAETVGPLVDLHGQHEHQALLSSATHVGYLDRWAGDSALEALEAYRIDLDAYRAAVAERASLDAKLAEVERNADYLRFVAEEIDRVSPEQGEDDALEAKLPALQHAEKLAEAASSALAALRGDGGALDSIAHAQASLARVAGIDPRVDEIASALADVAAVLEDSALSAREYAEGVEHDPALLDRVLSRLQALTGLKKKYGPSLDEVLVRRDEARAVLEAAEDSSGARAAAETAVEEAEACLRKSAAGLEKQRRASVPGFVSALTLASQDLSMDGASFDVAFSELAFDDWNREGPHRVEFLYSSAPAQSSRPLAKIASGGEVSRVMLALKGVLGSADSVETLVFDEIDAGIGGSTALSVGRRLAELARDHQVIVVTHLAQVAAYADRHLVVTKLVDEGRAVTSVGCVEGEHRVGEIARMLSGSDSKASREHARELLRSVSEEAAGAA